MLATKILMIEDDPLVMEAVCDGLEINGFDTVRAPGGPEGLEILQNNPIDLVLLDINMPDIDGVMTLETIKLDKRTKDIPILMLTGDAKEDIIAQCIQAGIADYIVKPIDIGHLVERIVKALEKS